MDFKGSLNQVIQSHQLVARNLELSKVLFKNDIFEKNSFLRKIITLSAIWMPKNYLLIQKNHENFTNFNCARKFYETLRASFFSLAHEMVSYSRYCKIFVVIEIF